jgi:hypothetical protein
MTAPPTMPPATQPDSTLAQAWRTQRQHLVRTLVMMSLLCSALAVALNGFSLRRLDTQLIYTFCIGFSCWLINVGVRMALAWVTDLRRRAQSAPASLKSSHWRSTVLGILFGLPLGPSVGMSLGDLLTGYETASLLDFGATSTRMTLAISMVASLVAWWAITTMENVSAAREQAQTAQRLATENQLRLLESQLEPHMLFNTLANLRVLITLDPPRAQAMLDQLISFLRATLAASRAGEHALSDEFARIADYLALMQVRMGARLQVQLDLPDELRALPVPPLLLQPLVENSIRHGLEPKVAGGLLRVTARREGSALCLSVRDTGVGLAGSGPRADTAGSHFGLEQVRARVAALHGQAAALTLTAAADGDGGVLAEVRLPWPASAQAK